MFNKFVQNFVSNFFAYPISIESDNENNLDNVTNSEFENNLSSSSSEKLPDSSENEPQSKKEVECEATYKYDGKMESFEEPIYDESITSDNENSSLIENNFDNSLSVDSIIKNIEN
ncbi:11373_t:CDS:2, partial [Cetraspora pellucida]